MKELNSFISQINSNSFVFFQVGMALLTSGEKVGVSVGGGTWGETCEALEARELDAPCVVREGPIQSSHTSVELRAIRTRIASLSSSILNCIKH